MEFSSLSLSYFTAVPEEMIRLMLDRGADLNGRHGQTLTTKYISGATTKDYADDNGNQRNII